MRKSEIIRKTKETEIICKLNLDGVGKYDIHTGIGFFNHMLELFSYHSLIDLELRVCGDTHVDLHHTVEDTGYVIAQAIIKALKDKKFMKGLEQKLLTFIGINTPILRSQELES